MTDALESIVDETTGEPSTRRTVLRGMAVVGAVAGTPAFVVACGDDGSGDATTDTDDRAGADGANENGSEDSGSDDSDSGDSDSGDSDSGDTGSDDSDSEDSGDEGSDDGAAAIAQTSQIDVGGGMIFEDEEIVITQPEEGTFVGLTSACSHKGCVLSDVTDGTINCASACGHGSQFDLNGAVTNGPATEPLAEVPITVDGENITRA